MTEAEWKTAGSKTPMFEGKHAVIEGDVLFGEDVSVWHNAVIRSESEPVRIGARSNIQDNCVLHTDEGYPLTIGEDVTIGHGAIVHGAVIEDGVLIGMGSIVMNGARIKKGALVAAGAVVPEHKMVEEGELVAGIPAKVLRIRSEEEQKDAIENADHYVKAARKRKEQNS
ncbi:gamma carbonic anhydrase family protein [Allobaculum mucilyticum]|uniref:gamma carbonic anhydrase family protein n=1 Tax=Allobaculum mucilyticum TaxID=2834459 RepID=UPI001E37923A|nr:gamma carbonic anhydrase family protein [Allobaculum mucilyticum]UNT95652.1 gamma carbonic anhydrase family protein [Allobaculum mucilyticum]